jgi:hypothetical protein
MTDHIGAFDRLYSKLAAVDNLAVTISNFDSITAKAITIAKTAPLLNITDQASLNTFSLAVAGISGDFFTDSQSGDIIIKSQSPNKRLLFGSGPTSDIIFDGGLTVNGGAGATGWSSLFSNSPTLSGLSASGLSNGFNFGWNVSGGQADSVMTYFIGSVLLPDARLDICSWDGATRTTTLSINRSGGVTFGTNLYPTIQGTNGQVLTTNGSGTLAWATVGGTGTVTSVALTTPSFLTVSGSPITGAGTFAITYSGTPLPVSNGGTGSTTSSGTGAVVLNTNATLSGTTLNGTTSVSQGIKVNGGGGATGWSSLFSGIGTGNNTGLSGNTNSNGFNFGWNVSAGDGENIMTYFTGAGSSPRLDICSWNGTTRTTTFSINSSGVALMPFGATVNVALNTPQVAGSGESGDLLLSSTRNINLSASSGVYANGRRLDVGQGANCFLFTGACPWPDATPSGLFFPYIPPTSYAPTGTPISFNPTTGAFTNQLGYEIVVTASYSLARDAASVGTSEFRIRLSYGSGISVARTKVAGIDWSSGTFTFSLPDQGNFIFEGSQTSGSGKNFFEGSFVTYSYARV